MNSDGIPICKVVLIGGICSGKNELFNKYNEDANIKEDYCIKTITVEGKAVKIQIFNTAGQKQYAPIVKLYYKNADVIVFVYNIRLRDSYTELKTFWFNEVKKENVSKDIKFALVGTNSDCYEFKKVTEKEAKQYAEENGAVFHTVSCKQNKGIEQLLEIIAKLYLNSKHDIQVNDNKKCLIY